MPQQIKQDEYSEDNANVLNSFQIEPDCISNQIINYSIPKKSDD